MSSGGQLQNKTQSAAGIAKVSELTDEAAALLRDGLAPREFLDLLIGKSLYVDAIRFLAHAMPKRESVWWAWVCARRASGEDPAPAIKAALAATEQWIAQPNDDNRRNAMEKAEAAEFGTPAGCAALAAFFTGGSVAPPEAPVVPPAEFASSKAVTGAIILAAVCDEPEKADEKLQASAMQGVEVANRIKLWDARK